MSGPDVKLTGVPLLGSFSDSEPDAARVSKKRKRDVTDATEKRTAGKKKGRKQKPEDVDFAALNMKLEVNSTIAHMDSRLMADHIAQKTKRFRPELSLVEAENFHVSGKVECDSAKRGPTLTLFQSEQSSTPRLSIRRGLPSIYLGSSSDLPAKGEIKRAKSFPKPLGRWARHTRLSLPPQVCVLRI